MIPRIQASGKSFDGLATYLTHDVKAETTKRVEWTHSLNCANDNTALVVDEMVWTYRQADLIKEQAGRGLGGRNLENPVKHVSLNWHPSEKPDRDHMIATSEAFLKRMGWEDHQTLIVAHNDKPHAHVHLMINRVHPETGVALSESFERLNASNWARDYEIEQRRLFCRERLKPEAEREKSPSRDEWAAVRQEDQTIEKPKQGRPALDTNDILHSSEHLTPEALEWRLLKNRQRHEREDFFEENKEAYREIRKAAYEDMRHEFSQDWKDYFKARRDQVDPEVLTAMKADIVERQTDWFNFDKEWGYAIFRGQRDFYYECLLEKHKAERATLQECQDRGERSEWLMEKGWGERNRDNRAEFEAARPVLDAEQRMDEARAMRRYLEELREQREAAEQDTRTSDFPKEPANDNSRQDAQPWWSEDQTGPKVRDTLDVASDATASAALGIASLAESLFDGFLGGSGKKATPQLPRTPSPSPEFPAENPFIRFAKEVKDRSEKQAREEYDQRYWDDRERKRE